MQMWIVGMMVWFALGWTVYGLARDRWAVPRLPARAARLVLVGAIVVTLAIEIAGVVGASPTRLETDENVKLTREIVRDILPHLDRDQSYLVRANGNRLFLGGVKEGVFWELLRRGYDVRAESMDPGLHDAHPTDSSVPHAVHMTVGDLNSYQGQQVAQYYTRDDDRRRRHAADVARLRQSLEERRPVVTDQGRVEAAVNPDTPIGRTLNELLKPDPDFDVVIKEAALIEAAFAGDVESQSFDGPLADRVLREERALVELELPVSV
jgi:hypothetical protein